MRLRDKSLSQSLLSLRIPITGDNLESRRRVGQKHNGHSTYPSCLGAVSEPRSNGLAGRTALGLAPRLTMLLLPSVAQDGR